MPSNPLKTEHFVLKGNAGDRVLATQLYFPGESRDADRALMVRMERDDGARTAVFDFVLYSNSEPDSGTPGK